MEKNEILLECIRLDNMSIDQLYILVAGVSEHEYFGLTDKEEKDRLEDRGKNKLRMHLTEIREALCENERFQKIMLNEKGMSRAEIAAAIVDIGISHIGLFPLCAVSLLIVKDFLKTLCHVPTPSSPV